MVVETKQRESVTAEKVSRSIGKLLEVFASEEMPKAVAETLIIRQQGDSPCAKWSIGNQIIMLANGTKDARGFRQWKEVGRWPKKNTAFHILGPNTKKIREQDKTTGEEEERTIVTGFYGIPVFRYEDTEGEEIERPDYVPLRLPPLYEVAERLGVTVDYAPFVGEALGIYTSGEKHIRLYTQDERVFFHELGHAADYHAANGKHKPGSIPAAEAEVVAETIAAVLCTMYGFEGYLLKSKEYIERHGSYGEAAGKAVGKVLHRVEKALELILSE